MKKKKRQKSFDKAINAEFYDKTWFIAQSRYKATATLFRDLQDFPNLSVVEKDMKENLNIYSLSTEFMTLFFHC